MTNNKKNGDALDFTQRFQIGHGTGTDATMDRPNEVTVFLFRDLDDMSAHFAHVYDRERLKITEGCRWRHEFILGNDPISADIWRPWN